MNRLQERRLALGLSQPDVSAKLKEIDPRMDVGMVSRFERGACLPTPLVLERLEIILQATRSDLFGSDELGVIHIAEAPRETKSHTTIMIQNAISSLQITVSSLSGSISSLQTAVSGIQEQITSLDARVTALESKNATT